MKRSDLIAKLARELGASKPSAAATLDAIFGGMLEAFERGDNIQLRGFGTFSVKKRAAQKRRNPRTGEPVMVPPRRIVHFKPLGDLAVWGVPGKKELLRQKVGRPARHKAGVVPGVRRCVREGVEGFEAKCGKRVRFFSIEGWGEEGARQFAETLVGMQEKGK